MKLVFDGLKDIKNETVMVNYVNYKVQTQWNHIEKEDGHDDDLEEEAFFRESRTKDDEYCFGCSKISGNNAVQDYTRRVFARDS